jgi:hypothetical protein
MELSYEPRPTRPVTHDELISFVNAADEAGENSLGTAAMIAYYWLQREEDIIARLGWSHYRPDDAPGVARIFHHKTRELVDIPLYDEDGTVLWPELMERLDAASTQSNGVSRLCSKGHRKQVTCASSRR